LTAVSEDVYGSPAELETKYGRRVVKGADGAEGLDGLLGRHGLEYRVFAVERNRSVDWGVSRRLCWRRCGCGCSGALRR
jgi:hypothetical protein